MPSGRVYYNEIEPHAAQWLRQLMDAGHIPAGDIDTRSIEDVVPTDLLGYDQCHFFAGLGGFPLALRWAGWPDAREIWTGSCPCQPFSAAGQGVGLADERHLWPAFFHLIEQCRPDFICGEQVERAIKHGWLDLVQDDLEGTGYAFVPVGLPAACVGADHTRPRLFWVARDAANTQRHQQPWQEPCSGTLGRVGRIKQPVPWDEPWPSALSRLRAEQDGLPRCVEGTDAARNAVVPQLAQAFIEAVMEI